MRRFLFASISFSLVVPQVIFAAGTTTVTDLKSSIQDKSTQVEKLNAEIKAVGSLVTTVKKEASTLSKALTTLDGAKKSLTKQIDTTKQQISATQGTIQNLSKSIAEKNRELNLKRSMVGETVRLLAEEESSSAVTTLLGYDSMGEYWAYEQGVEQLQKSLTVSIQEAKQAKQSLDQTKSIQEQEKSRLTDYSTQVSDKKKIVEATALEKQNLLSATKSKETEYQKLLAQKQKEKDAVETELLNYESQLRFTLDPSSIPASGTNVLRWPLMNPIITQYFGNTAFSRSKAGSAYNGKGHNGIDMGTPVGTAVYAAQNGTIRGFGNTDIACKGASYGNWILIDHDGINMSTLYGHLSLISVKVGQTVKAGDRIAYSGNTGYSTGPHLHFSLFATEGVSIQRLQSKVKTCGVYTLPVAAFSSYLNPIDYLP